MEFRIKHSTNFNILDTTKDNMINTVYGKEPSLFKLGTNNIKENNKQTYVDIYIPYFLKDLFIKEKIYNKNKILNQINFYKWWELISLLDIRKDDNLLLLTMDSNISCYSYLIYNKKIKHNNNAVIVLSKENSTTQDPEYDKYINYQKEIEWYKSSNLKSILLNLKKKYHTIFFDYEKYESNQLLYTLSATYLVLNLQKKDGIFILKINKILNYVNLKIIKLLSIFYEEVSITKPYSSLFGVNELYIICNGFKSVDSKYDFAIINIIKKIEDIYAKNCKKKLKVIDDLFVNWEIPEIEINEIKNFNNELYVRQYKNISSKNVKIDDVVKFRKQANKKLQKWKELFLSKN